MILNISNNINDSNYINQYTTASVKRLKDEFTFAEKLTAENDEEKITQAYFNLSQAVEKLKEKAYTISLESNYAVGGKIIGGGAFASDEFGMIEARPATGYRFDGWYEGAGLTEEDLKGTPVSTELSYTVDARDTDVTYTAKFTQINSLSIMTLGSGVVYLNDDSISADYTGNAAVGTKITLKAVAAEGYEFVYWMDKDNRVLSYKADEFITYVGSGTQINAVFQAITNNLDNKWNYRFVHKNGNVIRSNNAVEGSTITVPDNNPYLIGYTFIGWKIKGTDGSELVDFDTFTISSNTVFEAVFEKEETTYSVNITDGFISGTEETSGNYVFDSKVTVSAGEAPGKMVFSYWVNSEYKIVSYDENYTFYVAGDTRLTAIFADEAADEIPTIAGTITKRDEVNHTISFLFDRNVSENYTMIQTGCIMTDDEKIGLSDGFVLGADGVDITKKATSQEGTGQYMITKGNVTTTWYVRGYLTYKDKDGVAVTIYTDVLTGSLS